MTRPHLTQATSGRLWVEGRIHQLPPYGALAIFLLPTLLLLPVKLLALWLIGQGKVQVSITPR